MAGPDSASLPQYHNIFRQLSSPHHPVVFSVWGAIAFNYFDAFRIVHVHTYILYNPNRRKERTLRFRSSFFHSTQLQCAMNTK